MANTAASPAQPTTLGGIFAPFFKLGFTSFGGPAAHLGFFRTEFVERKKWLTDESYTSMVAMCQFMPGPASSQVGMLIGFQRGGYLGALVAFLGFTLPSAVLMIVAALGVTGLSGDLAAGVFAGLKVVAVVVVAHAVLGMARTLCKGVPELVVMAAAVAAVLLVAQAWVHLVVIAAAAVAGLVWFRGRHDATTPIELPPAGHRNMWWWLIAFGILFVGLIAVVSLTASPVVESVERFFRAGSLVFGGGHVVLPLLAAETVGQGLIASDDFLTGYATAQALPGPLFTFAAYLGAAGAAHPGGVIGGVIALVAIFVPGMMLALGAYPLWTRIATHHMARAAIIGINAAVVGVLLAALYDPVFVSAISSATSASLMIVLAVMLMGAKLPPWLVVIVGAVAGAVAL